MARKHRLQLSFAAFIIALLLVQAMPVNAFSGGSGARMDPYLIATAEDLMSIGSDPNLLQSHFRLVSDIDLDPNLPGGRVFGRAVIAPSQGRNKVGIRHTNGRACESIFEGLPFAGSFDGNGYVIANLTIQGESTLGLFGKISSAGVVHDISLIGVNITGALDGPSVASMLVPENDGTITACHAEGVLQRGFGGALVTVNRGRIVNSHAVSTHREYLSWGGLAASNAGVIMACYAVLNASSLESSGGGLAGRNIGAIIDCYAMGAGEVLPSTFRSAGGLVGINMGTIASSYTTVALRVDPDAVQAGALVGKGQNDGRLGYSCFLESVAADANDPGTPLSDTAMKDADSFVAWDFYDAEVDGAFDNWFMPDDAYPVLSWQTEVTGLVKPPIVKYRTLEQVRERLERMGLLVGEIRYDFDEDVPDGRAICVSPSIYVALGERVDIVLSRGAYDWAVNPGSGQADSPYQIHGPGQFRSLTLDPNLWDKHFVLTQDIDMGRFTYADSPIARDVNDLDIEYEGTSFTGSFDGNHFCLSNLNIIALDLSTHLGLFGHVSAGAEIKNLNLTNFFLYSGECSYAVGTLAGSNAGRIDNCHINGMLNTGPRTTIVGGMVGIHEGVIQNCHAACLLLSAWGNGHVGGLVGDNLGSVTQSGARCRIWGGMYQDTVGGLAGYHNGERHQVFSAGEINVGLECGTIGALVGEVNTETSLGGGDWCDICGDKPTRVFNWDGRIEARISQSHASCDIFCGPCCSHVGGFAGIGANIVDCYATGRIVAINPNGNLGGFSGEVENVIQNNYSTTHITVHSSDEDCGKCRRCEMAPSVFIAEADSQSQISGCFHLSLPSGDVTDNGLSTVLTDEQMRLQQSFVGWDFLGELENGSNEIWFMPEDGYPILARERED